ncbi:MBL fold metallo-hydrolase RNA specificity domain-containing protein [Idiomarina seosinensis]|uniref:MBL fold hydrolase n=1 Tax=Idiomarina seosinensis TaxID=281739 RepID=A0A432ZHS1_9GAMM|nr:MBL fold metallo-hydrolase [Idiomarina seosinensis]RUO77453.1 MBL fold hydrolase [Idiomarina seosinensis]
MNIIHHGGFNQVTGSCHQLQLSATESYLIDCGLMQGEQQSQPPEVDFYSADIKALLVTHCHLDHVGRIPYLLAAGFKGPIVCTQATARLLPLVIADAIKVGITRNAELIEGVLSQLQQQLMPVAYDQWLGLSQHLKVRFKNAGHIMGSAFIECSIDDHQRVVFSGDIGCRGTPLLPDPDTLDGADLLLLESTYGNRLHESRKHRQQRLKSIISRCIEDRGAVLIPAFSIGRTQELLYELEAIWHELEVAQTHNFPEVVIDSPLAAEFNEVYGELSQLWDEQAKARLKEGRHPLDFNHCHTVQQHSTHLELVNRIRSTSEPVIIIAASGMCSGGRIVNYLKALLPDRRTDVLFVGYQAKGTAGRDIQRYGPEGGYVILGGERIDIKAQIHTLGGYSAHADQQELLDFIGSSQSPVKRVRLIHGEYDAQAQLAEKIYQRFSIPVETAAGSIYE